ncbi:MAG: hypothetical protein AB7O70_13965 [Hyphomicrobiales bacterium]
MSTDTQAQKPGPSRRRKWIVFLLGFPVSLALGWVFGKITNPETYSGAQELQAAWYDTVSRMSPVALVTGYVDDVVRMATTDPFAPEPQPRIVSPPTPFPAIGPETECERLDKALPPPCSTPVGVYDPRGLAECMAASQPAIKRFKEKCPGVEPYSLRAKRMAAAPRAPLYVEQKPHRTDWRQVLGSPLFAIALTWNRLTAEGGISYFLAVAMLLGGLAGFMVLHARLFSTWNRTRYFPQGFLANVLLVPPAVIACASVVCFFLKYIMLGALGLFGWVTGLAGLCCAATGTAGYAWWISHKFAQYSVGKVIAPKA